MERMLQTLERSIHFLHVEAQEAQQRSSEAQLFLESEVDPRGCTPERIKTPRGSNSAQSHPLQQLSLELEAIKVIEPLSTAADRIEAARLWHRADPWVRSLLDRARQQVTLSQLRLLVARTTIEVRTSAPETATSYELSNPEGSTGHSQENSVETLHELAENVHTMKEQGVTWRYKHKAAGYHHSQMLNKYGSEVGFTLVAGQRGITFDHVQTFVDTESKFSRNHSSLSTRSVTTTKSWKKKGTRSVSAMLSLALKAHDKNKKRNNNNENIFCP